jgi:large subunit ribosomal protein L4
MIQLPVYNFEGKEIRSITLDDRVFALPKNDALLHEVYVSLSANERGVYAHTKGRGERAGSGRNPWKQKHTGRARAGSVRSPLWRKGGVVFGPKKDRNFSKKINRKARQKAMKIALSEKVRSGTIRIVDSFALPEWKTKRVALALTSLGISGKSAILAFSKEEVGIDRASQNISQVSPVSIHTLNTKELLDHKFLLMSALSVAELEKRCAENIETAL